MKRIFIATPTAGGNAPIAYTQSLVAASLAIHAAGRSYRYLTIDGADVVFARNVLAHVFLQDDSCDYLLFVDSDMAIDARVFSQFIAAEKPLIGAVYAQRAIDLGAYARAMADQPDDRRARALASDFNVLTAPGPQTIRDNLMEVAAFGCGCVMIHRSVFASLIAGDHVSTFVSSRLSRLGIQGTVWDFFGEIPMDTGERLSEDYSFCARVRALGTVPLLGYVGDGVGHVGQFTYSGPYSAKLQSDPR